MRKVYKYIVVADDQTHLVEVPGRGMIVHVGQQGVMGEVCVWIQVDPEQKSEWRRFKVFGTGQPIGEEWYHVGSTIQGPFVWHLYHLGEP